MPTLAVERPVHNAPVILPTVDTGVLEEVGKSRRRASLLAPLLLSFLVVIGVAGIIVWQAGLIPAQLIPFGRDHDAVQSRGVQSQPIPDRGTTQPESNPGQVSATPETQPAAAEPVPPQASAQEPVAQQSSVQQAEEPPQTAKPSPFEPTAKIPQQSEPQPREIVRIPAPRYQDVWVTTNPPGAKAVLDDNFAQSCQTPCMLHGLSGVHRLTISQAGYENESREIHIAGTATDVPPISLRRPSGTLWLTTNPPGASVRINGKLVPETTPAQITLPPGSYTVTVEKGGNAQTERIELGERPIYLRIPLEQ